MIEDEWGEYDGDEWERAALMVGASVRGMREAYGRLLTSLTEATDNMDAIALHLRAAPGGGRQSGGGAIRPSWSHRRT